MLLYKNFYYMVFTRHSDGKIWSSIFKQDSVKLKLHYEINLILSNSFFVSDLFDRLQPMTIFKT